MGPPPKQLPWELEEEILSRLPLKALIRCRTVCKRWNSLFNDKSFLKNLLPRSQSHPQFIFVTASKVYSIDIIGIDPNSIIVPKIELFDLPSSDIPFRNLDYTNITTCDEFLFCTNDWVWEDKTAVWNPWLRQVTWIEHKVNEFFVVGLGYDNSRPDKVYKMLVWNVQGDPPYQSVAIYECASHAFKSIDTPDDYWHLSTRTIRYVPLNGNLYWVAFNLKTCKYFIQSFDFSTETFKPLCLLPCQQNHGSHNLLLEVFEGDRFSLLKLCNEKSNIGIWVTKKRISYNNGGDGEGVVWMNLMTLSATNLPTLFSNDMFYCRISYIIYDKTIFMCCDDGETGVACIYVVKKDLCKKIHVDPEIVNFSHCVCAPNLISIPSFV